jgi:NTP pyrophosphatase (non-canonical NTP hydrolase)
LAGEPFGIGSEVWPGLAKVAEEAGELLQVVGKLVATGGRTAHHDGTDLRARLVEECGDLLAAIGYLTAANGLEAEVAERAAGKREIFDGWHRREVIVKPPGPHDHPPAGAPGQTSTVSS